MPVVLTPTCYLKHAVTEENARTSLCFEPHLIDGLCQPTVMRTRGIILTPLRLYARSALGVTNEYIAAPSNCAARPVPERAVVSLSRGGGTSAPAADGARPPPAVFVAVTRHPLERWQSEMSYGRAVAMKNLEGVWRLFAPRGVTDTGHGFPRWLRRGKIYPRADASAGELIAAEASLRAWMAHDWERDGDPEGGWKHCGPGGHMHRGRRLKADCYVDNQLVRILSADCRCRLYGAAALHRALRPGVAEAVASVSSGESSDGLLTASESSHPGPWLIFNNFENLQNATDGRNYTVGELSGCPLETHAPVTRVHLDRAKEVAGRYHVLAAMEDAVAGGGVVFGNVLRALTGMNVSRGFRLGHNEHASPASLQLLAVPGMRRALAESNWADLELFRWMRQDLWPRYVAEAARVEAANQLG